MPLFTVTPELERTPRLRLWWNLARRVWILVVFVLCGAVRDIRSLTLSPTLEVDYLILSFLVCATRLSYLIED